jgi:hypothetical protein
MAGQAKRPLLGYHQGAMQADGWMAWQVRLPSQWAEGTAGNRILVAATSQMVATQRRSCHDPLHCWERVLASHTHHTQAQTGERMVRGLSTTERAQVGAGCVQQPLQLVRLTGWATAHHQREWRKGISKARVSARKTPRLSRQQLPKVPHEGHHHAPVLLRSPGATHTSHSHPQIIETHVRHTPDGDLSQATLAAMQGGHQGSMAPAADASTV